MAHNVDIQGLSGAGFRVPKTGGGFARVKEGVTASVDIDDHKTQLLLAGERDNFIRTQHASGTFTVSIATPAVVTKNGHGFANGDIVVFSTTGALPTGLTAGTKYYVINTSTNTFRVAATYGGSAINTTGSQSGTHTVTAGSVFLVGLSRRGFRVPQVSDGAYKLVKAGGSAIQVDLTDGRVRRILYRSKRDWVSSTSTTSLSIRGIQNEQNGFELKSTAGEDQSNIALDSNANNAANTETVVVGTDTYTFKTALTEAKATDTVATTAGGGGAPADGDTVVVNGRTYTFRTALTPAADEVLIAGQDNSLVNLAHAINQSGGVPGTDYVVGAANASVTANPTVASHLITLTAISIGTAGNSLTLAVTGTHLARGAATFSGGLDSVANEVKVAGSGAASLTNLSEAINAGANGGVDYSSATVANPDATASALVVATNDYITVSKIEDSTLDVVVSTTAAHLTVSNALIQDVIQKVYRLVTVVSDPADESVFQALRRYYKLWIEA